MSELMSQLSADQCHQVTVMPGLRARDSIHGATCRKYVCLCKSRPDLFSAEETV